MTKYARLAAPVAVVVLIALTGCTPSTGSGDGGGEGDGTGTVKMVLWPGPEGEAMGDVVDQYNATRGDDEGIKVDMTLLSRQDTFSKESTLMAAKSDEQDIYFVASYNVGQFANALEPLDDIDAQNYFPVAASSLQYEEEQYALPLDISSHFLMYRKDLIDGLLDDSQQKRAYERIAKEVLGEARAPKPPQEWDWDDYKVMAAYFSESTNSSSPTEYGTILQAKNLLYNTMVWDDVLWGMGGSWTTPDGEANLDTPQAKAAVQLYADIYQNGWTSPDSSQAEFPETQAALQSGNTAFAIHWSAGFAELNDKATSPKVAGKIALAPVPGRKTHVHALAVALNKYSENKDAAKDFLEYLAEPEAMSVYAKAGGIPAMPEVLEQEADVNPVFEQVSSSIATDGYSPPVLPNTFQIYSKLAERLSPAWVGDAEADEAVADANAELEALLE